MSFLPFFLIFLGLYLLFNLRFFFILHPIKTIRSLGCALSTKEARQNLALSLSGTLGVGNILGVAIAISLGGTGAVFWLLFSSLFSMIIKYSESSLSADYSGEWGIVGVFKILFFRYGKYISYLYAILIIVLSFLLGSSVQAYAVVSCGSRFGISKYLSIFLISIILIFVIINGRERIKGLATILIPVASLVYMSLTLFVIILRLDRLPEVISDILKNAFRADSMTGGILGFFANNSIHRGFSAGLMSNEAGTGTSSLANAEGIANPHHAGLVGMVEVFFDTVVICSLSAFAILLSFDGDFSAMGGMEIVFLSLGRAFFGYGDYILLFSVTLFAISSIICWYYYGVKCVMYLGIKRKSVYSFFFILSFNLAIIFDEVVLTGISNFLLLILTIFTSFVLIKSSDRINGYRSIRF